MSRRCVPGVADLVFGLVLVSVLFGGRFRLLNDPGTLWHLRLGREILRTGEVPRVDSLTFTHPGEPWVDQSWLFDTILALVVDQGGWSAAALIAVLGIAAIYGSLARGLIRDGRSPQVVLVVAFLAAGVGSIHFLIRPHLVTLGFVLATLRLCQRQHEVGGRWVYVVPGLMIVWANMHGGFLAGPLIVLTSALGHAVSGRWDDARRRNVAAFVKSGALSLLTALVNPYGFELYRHVGRLLLTSGVTVLIAEYQPVPFGQPDARALECVLLALVAMPNVSRSRMTGYELTQSLVWLHLSLASVRHAPLFALAVAPGLARLLDGLPFVTHEVAAENDPASRSIWPALAALGLALAVASGATLTTLDPSHWPLSALKALNREPTEARLFHEQDWGGLIEAETVPLRRTFIDDRFELFGKQAVLSYLNALEGGPDWDEIRDRDGITLVWIRPERGLARRLAVDPQWKVVQQDQVSVLYERVRFRHDEFLGGSNAKLGLTFRGQRTIFNPLAIKSGRRVPMDWTGHNPRPEPVDSRAAP